MRACAFELLAMESPMRMKENRMSSSTFAMSSMTFELRAMETLLRAMTFGMRAAAIRQGRVQNDVRCPLFRLPFPPP